ncbi:hypothetical protein [Cloacibacterium caeni]|nr:hypothetical protein [Cloacibacterium caeni]
MYKIPNRNLSTIEKDMYGLVINQAEDKYIIEADKVFSEVKIFNTSGSYR